MSGRERGGLTYLCAVDRTKRAIRILLGKLQVRIRLAQKVLDEWMSQNAGTNTSVENV